MHTKGSMIYRETRIETHTVQGFATAALVAYLVKTYGKEIVDRHLPHIVTAVEHVEVEFHEGRYHD